MRLFRGTMRRKETAFQVEYHNIVELRRTQCVNAKVYLLQKNCAGLMGEGGGGRQMMAPKGVHVIMPESRRYASLPEGELRL